MPDPWLKRIRQTGQLTVFNKASTWALPVDAAMRSLNNLSLGVKVVAANEEKAANIVLVLTNGPGEKYQYYGDTATTAAWFKADRLHGQTSTLHDPKSHEIFFAAVFLPARVNRATESQKQMIVLHELIHACGLDNWHDSVGIMFENMEPKDGGLIEYLHGKDARPMPPVRVGPQTLCKMQILWSPLILLENVNIPVASLDCD
jgi:hypothetical protein